MLKGIVVVLSLFAFNVLAENSTKENQWITDWETYDSKEGIEISCKTHKSNVDICRYTTVTDLTPDALLAVNIDGPNLKNWMENVMTSEVLEFSSAFDYQMYTTYDFPGARNRDSVTHSTVSKDPKTGTITLAFESVVNEKKPEDLRFVRFPLLKGAWKFIPQANGKTKILYSTMALPGEYVQKFLTDIYNYTSRSSSVKTVLNLLQQAAKPKYQRFKISSIN